MPKGISLHIGLNSVNPTAYEGWSGDLTACENDAHSMSGLAKKLKYKSSVLLTKQATSAAVIKAIGDAARQLAANDIFFLTYSGHGGQVPDTGGDEKDGKDESWVLWDRELIDDELYAMWQKFKSGVRIVVLSDSCHSGTVTREYYATVAPMEHSMNLRPNGIVRPRRIPSPIADKVYKAHQKEYDAIQKKYPDAERGTVKASVLLISGCQDSQLSSDGDVNGLFTENLLKVWNSGHFAGDYESFHEKIRRRMPPSQTPRLYFAGVRKAPFEKQKPFTIASAMAKGAGR